MWLANEWFVERGFTLKDGGRFVKVLKNKCQIQVANNQIPFGKVDICLFEPDNRLSIISFSSERECGVDPVELFAALLKISEEQLLKI